LAIAGLSRVPFKGGIALGGRYGHLLNEIPPGLNYSYFTEEMGHPSPVFAWRSKFSDFLYKADPEKPVRTIKAQGGQYTGPFHWDSRPFTVEEFKRLQTFPDSYEIVGNRQVAVHQIGNSVPPQIARVLAVSIRQQLFGDRTLPALPQLEPREILGFRQRKRRLTDEYRRSASEAIGRHSADSSRAISLPSTRQFFCELDGGIEIRNSVASAASFRVRQRILKSEWVFEAESLIGRRADDSRIESGFEVVVVPRDVRGWGLPVKRVRLVGQRLDEKLLTLCWKSFEQAVTLSKLRADLVQLCGYYQYPSSFVGSLKLSGKRLNWKWRALAKIHQGVATREILAAEEIAARLEIKIDRVSELAVWLKGIGYEVRNHSTNPQINPGCYLIPYAFPTLSTLSVQFRKSL
jgi:DNA (cytosine-5)-methyltransferase 1